MSEPIECPACGEITLRHTATSENRPYIETWECDCGHIQCYHVQKKREVEYPGFDAFIHRIGMNVIDEMGKIEAMQLAFLGGRNYEAQRDLEALRELNLTKRQAE